MKLKQIDFMKYWTIPANWKGNKTVKLYELMTNGQYAAQIKRDGILFRYVSEVGVLSFQSRTNAANAPGFVDKIENIPHIIDFLKEHVPDGTILLGEICLPDRRYTSKDITKIMGCKPMEARRRQYQTDVYGGPLHYYIFDILYLDNLSQINKPFLVRQGVLQNFFAKLELPDFIEIAETIEYDIPQKVEAALLRGEEGVVLYKKTEPYHPGKRPAWSTVKIKRSIDVDVDAFVIGFVTPTREYQGENLATWDYWIDERTNERLHGQYFKTMHVDGRMLTPVTKNYFYDWPSGLIIGVYDQKGAIVKIGKVSNFTDKLKASFATNPEQWMGKPLQVHAMSIDPENTTLRHPVFVRFRDDINASDCTLDKILL